jgi:hypothetical protein
VALLFGLLLVLTPMFVSAAIGGLIGSLKGEQTTGCCLGFFLGPIGWLVVMNVPDLRLRCPHCYGVLPVTQAEVDRGALASRCCHCGQQIRIKTTQQMAAARELIETRQARAWSQERRRADLTHRSEVKPAVPSSSEPPSPAERDPGFLAWAEAHPFPRGDLDLTLPIEPEEPPKKPLR